MYVVRDTALLRTEGSDVGSIRTSLSATAAHFAARLKQRGVDGVRVDPVIRAGAPYAELLEEAARMEAELLVVGRHGGGGLQKLLVGSTAERVVRGRVCPVLVVSKEGRAPYSRSLVAVDPENAYSKGPLDTALRVLGKGAAPAGFVAAYEVAHEGYMRTSGVSARAIGEMRRRREGECQDAISSLRRHRLPRMAKTATDIERGDARRVILDVADRRRSDLVVLGTSARRGLPRFFLGSVAADVLRSATIDVLIVPPSGR